MNERKVPDSQLIVGDERLSDDLHAMQELFGSDFDDLAALFQSDTTKRLSALQQASAESNINEAIRLTHALSGSASSMGATHLSALCKKLELQLKSGSLEELALQLAEINTHYAVIDAKLQKMVKSV